MHLSFTSLHKRKCWSYCVTLSLLRHIQWMRARGTTHLDIYHVIHAWWKTFVSRFTLLCHLNFRASFCIVDLPVLLCMQNYFIVLWQPLSWKANQFQKKNYITHRWMTKNQFQKKYSLFMILFPSFGKDNKKLGYSFVYLKIILKIIFVSQSLILSIITDFKISLKSWIDKENIKYLFCVTGFVTWGI